MDPSLLLGRNPVVGRDGPIPTGILPGQGETTAPHAPIGASCQDGGPGRICLGLKYVVYIDPKDGASVVAQEGAAAIVASVNRLWHPCGVQFQLEQYLTVRASDYRLNFNTASFEELDQIRAAFDESGEFLVVATGAWDRTGTLNLTGANAWTSMPGVGAHGTVIEQPVSSFANIMAHELGHYLGLLHVQDDSDLMSPMIFANSTALDADQCVAGRAAAAFFWPRMYR